ncbi:hypothetical protein EV189_3977 [Motilibacter rhizosphaerae]|uniref:Uncharacterized protein n=1 Tax=Motilibacter rhizosphaerae TaxID=598652 RepID=A0A4Q7N7I8_9ACTN|nr:hypothetical protein [Motilibacter rhizosphaerae]RZS77937.1 hypothetical protein EV189_3977 [Motilibacter rhizosphaerae]
MPDVNIMISVDLTYSQEEQDALLERPDSWSRGYFAQHRVLPSDLTDEEMDAALAHALRPLLFTLGLLSEPKAPS